jgi:hypothetical protein
MFEIKAGLTLNERLGALFSRIGYRLFSQLAGAPILVPDDASQPLDGYKLNLFAAKPDRVSSMGATGFLVDAMPAWRPSEADRKNAKSFWRSQTFARQADMARLIGTGASSASSDSGYIDSLAAYATWRAADQPAATRCAALEFALRGVRSAVARAPTAAPFLDRSSHCLGMGRSRRRRWRFAAPPRIGARRPYPSGRAVLAPKPALRRHTPRHLSRARNSRANTAVLSRMRDPYSTEASSSLPSCHSFHEVIKT